LAGEPNHSDLKSQTHWDEILGTMGNGNHKRIKSCTATFGG
jgi:hypothetical protein